MTNEGKAKLLAEMLDVDEQSIKPEVALADIEEWDSMAVISFIALMDSKFGKRLTANEIKGFETFQDVFDVME